MFNFKRTYSSLCGNTDRICSYRASFVCLSFWLNKKLQVMFFTFFLLYLYTLRIMRSKTFGIRQNITFRIRLLSDTNYSNKYCSFNTNQSVLFVIKMQRPKECFSGAFRAVWHRRNCYWLLYWRCSSVN